MKISFQVDSTAGGCRADDFLQQQISAAPQAYLGQLFKKGKILCAGEAVARDRLLSPGECLDLPDSGRLRELIELSGTLPAAPVVLFENNEILIVDKPAGLAVHASDGHQAANLTDLLQQQAAKRGDRFRIAPVQRLDLESSGACLFGKGRQALSELGQLMMEHQLKKTYLALVAGDYAGPEELTSSVRAKGKIKSASCRVKRLSGNRDASLLQVELLTGRQHQIRQQLAQQGSPLYGDRRYRGPCPTELPRVFLHSYRLFFHSPFGGEPIEVSAPLPAELSTFLQQLGLALPEG